MDKPHLNALAAKHAGIDRQIDFEMQRPLPDQVTLARLKKQKLRLKEALISA